MARPSPVGGRARVSRLQLGTQAGGELILAPRPRLSALWQAQIEQLAGQIADLGDPAPAANMLAQSFGRLPPCGLLPTNVFDLATHSSGFFPGGFDLDAVPVPLEQLDLAVREAAPLAPLDFSLGERVRVLVPVSQASWEPRLLLTETIDPLFQQTLDGYLLERSRALGARQGLRLTEATLRQAIDATAARGARHRGRSRCSGDGEFRPVGSAAGQQRTSRYADAGPAPALLRFCHGHHYARAGDSLYAWVYLDPDNPAADLDAAMAVRELGASRILGCEQYRLGHGRDCVAPANGRPSSTGRMGSAGRSRGQRRTRWTKHYRHGIHFVRWPGCLWPQRSIGGWHRKCLVRSDAPRGSRAARGLHVGLPHAQCACGRPSNRASIWSMRLQVPPHRPLQVSAV